MTNLSSFSFPPIRQSLADPNSTYLKAARVYDDGSIKTKYYAQAIRDDDGIRPP
jgi:hypothetical protein